KCRTRPSIGQTPENSDFCGSPALQGPQIPHIQPHSGEILHISLPYGPPLPIRRPAARAASKPWSMGRERCVSEVACSVYSRQTAAGANSPLSTIQEGLRSGRAAKDAFRLFWLTYQIIYTFNIPIDLDGFII